MSTRSIMIQGEKFEVSQPYAAGHVLTEVEAKVLNQTRSENIRNNLAKLVKDAKGEADALNPDQHAELQAKIAEYDAEYTFSTPGTGGTAARRLDPVEREARTIAREAIKAKLAAEGRKLKDVDPEKLEAAIEHVASQENTLKIAKKRVAERQKAQSELLDGLELGDAA